MLTYQTHIENSSKNNLASSPNLRTQHSPNKRGCCQSKRRNYNLLTSSNGISAANDKTCCSQKKNNSKPTNVNTRRPNKPNKNYSKAEIDAFKSDFEQLVSSGLIRLNEFLEVYEKGSKQLYPQYTKDEVKAQLLNPELKLDVVSRIDENNKSININIIDTNKNKKYLDQTFNFKKSESNIEKYEESVSVITLSRWLALQNLYAKSEKYPSYKKEKEKIYPKEIKESECKEKYGIDSECMCINHDMGCSAITSQSGNLQLWTPCLGKFEVDIFDCCYEHDIDLWCSSDGFEVITYGFEPSSYGAKLISCFESKIVAKYTYLSPFYCELFELPVLWLVLLGIPNILSGLIGIGLQGSPERRNIDGKNSKSCLCGGDVPTVCCGGFSGVCNDECCNKVELCSNKVDKTRGEGCTPKPKCGKKCDYSVHHNYYYPHLETIVNTYSLTSKVSYYKGGNVQEILPIEDCCSTNLTEKCTDECFNCFYACQKDPSTKKYNWNNGKILVDSSHLKPHLQGIPCCDGTPNEDLNDKSNYCNFNLNKSGGRPLPPCGTPLVAKLGGPCLETNKNDNRNHNLTSLSQIVI